MQSAFPPVDRLVGSPQEVRDILRYERQLGYKVDVLFWKRLNAWSIEIWY